jgi:hypothetical protein
LHEDVDGPKADATTKIVLGAAGFSAFVSVSGAQMVATAVNAAWGTSFTPTNVMAGLANGLPTP